MNKIKILFVFAVFVLTVSGCNVSEEHSIYESTENAVYFLDVGQGDSILVKSGDEYMLVDAGEEDKGRDVVEYLYDIGVDKIKYVVATHPHSDHIGGMDDVINSFKVENIIMPDAPASTRCFSNMLNAVEDNNINVIKGEAGCSFELGDIKCSIAAPIKIGDDANNNSVVMKLVYNNDSVLLTGDCSKEEEGTIIESGTDILANVLKAGHHGSSTSSTKEFLKRVNPQYAVISCGENNDYGHPHRETVESFNKYGIETYRTDKNGVIIAELTGNGVIMRTESENYREQNSGTSVSSKGNNVNNDINSGYEEENTYILNESSKKIHRPDCSGAEGISSKNKKEFKGNIEELLKKGYSVCGICKPE